MAINADVTVCIGVHNPYRYESIRGQAATKAQIEAAEKVKCGLTKKASAEWTPLVPMKALDAGYQDTRCVIEYAYRVWCSQTRDVVGCNGSLLSFEAISRSIVVPRN